MEETKILIISDLHHTHHTGQSCPHPSRRGEKALDLLKKVLLAEKNNVHLLVLLGDLLDDGNLEGAMEDLMEIRDAVEMSAIPALALAGNHDGPSGAIADVFGTREGLYRMKGCSLVLFNDAYDTFDRCARDREKMLAYLGETPEGEPLIVFQHNPVHPAIDSPYPYNLEDAACIAEVYAEHRVMISVSGHYHRGIPLQEKEGVSYFVCPALCEAPFSYAVLTLRENGFHLETKRLDLSHAVMLHDLHVHTRLAYCGKEEMEPEAILEAAGLLNLSGFAFTEHMAQLYVPGEDFWSGRFVDHPGMMERNMGTCHDRVSVYRELVGGCRNGRVLMGVEAEVDKDGRLCMLERDQNIWDIVLGAVHFLPGRWADKPLQGFMWANERLAENRVDILAHPFRFFRKREGGPPKDLYRPLARILREHRVAAEVNFHINRPDPSFFRICLEEGVRISLGSDAHELHMIGCDWRYVDFLETLAPQEQWADFLYRPGR